jgi:DNA-binding response OmpR family regulator
MERAPHLARTALVVDDDAFIVSALAEVLSEDGFEVKVASNGFSAARLAIECRPTVILLDLVLPERSGADVLAELRDDPTTRDTAIVVVTAHAELITDALIAETDGVVAKPFDLDELLATVHRAIRSAAHRQAEVAPVAATSRRELAMRARRAGVRRRR